MDPLKSPGDDGFPALFYQKFWRIIGNEVSDYCLGVLNRSINLDGNNHTNIVLISKVDNPRTISQYRPISLCSVLFKIISKVIANRLRQILDYVIDEAQSGFVPGRLISDNIVVAYEMIHALKSKKTCLIGKYALKLDMSKAYDRVEWNFIEDMMRRKGFDENWINLVMHCVRTVSYSVVVNGRKYSHIEPSIGLRQGDPLSPYLFLICSEGFSTLLQMATEDGSISGMKASRYGPEVSHLFFADDSIVFGEATIAKTLKLREIIDEYSRCSGQVINFEKSVVLFSPNISQYDAQLILDILGICRVWNLDNYLGLPTMVGKNKKASFLYLKDRIHERIEGWTSRYLSQAGREVFLKSVLQSLPTYAMSCFLLPRSLCHDFNRIYNRFWWKQKKNGSGIFWSTWNYICVPKEYGGMGFRDMGSFNIALLARQGWRLIMNPNSLAARVLQAKYYADSDFINAKLGSSPSYTWRSIWSAKGLLKSGLCWRIGNGKDVHIWDDKWIPAAYSKSIQYTSRNDSFNQVSDLISNDGTKWNEEIITTYFDARDASKILEIPLSSNDAADDVFWHPCKIGNYSTSSGYQLLQMKDFYNPGTYQYNIPEYTCYKRLWNLSLPAKIKVCGWRIMQNFLSTKENLWIKKIVGNDICPKCNNDIENLAHLFVSCSYIQGIWGKFGISWQSLASTEDFLDYMEHLSNTSTDEVLVQIYTVLWCIWTRRNLKVHENKNETVEDIYRFASSNLHEWQASKINLAPIRRVIEQDQWTPPSYNWYKLNFDASYSTNSKIAKLGGIIRNHLGDFIGGYNHAVNNVPDATTAEVLSCKMGIQMAISCDIERLVIEGDALNIIKRLKSNGEDMAPSGRIVKDCKILINNINIVKVQHVKRNLNVAAHVFAQKGIIRSEPRYWHDEPPDFARHL